MHNKKGDSKMSKKEVKEVIENNSEDKIQSSIEPLQAQLKDYRGKAQYFGTMATKVEGALEVLMQLSDEEEEPKDK